MAGPTTCSRAATPTNLWSTSDINNRVKGSLLAFRQCAENGREGDGPQKRTKYIVFTRSALKRFHTLEDYIHILFLTMTPAHQPVRYERIEGRIYLEVYIHTYIFICFGGFPRCTACIGCTSSRIGPHLGSTLVPNGRLRHEPDGNGAPVVQ